MERTEFGRAIRLRLRQVEIGMAQSLSPRVMAQDVQTLGQDSSVSQLRYRPTALFRAASEPVVKLLRPWHYPGRRWHRLTRVAGPPVRLSTFDAC